MGDYIHPLMISIVGAGPIGCYTAYLLAKSGETVQIFEKNKKIGQHIKCTGLVTSKIEQLIHIPDSLIMNKIKKVKVNSPNVSTIFKLRNPELILNRTKFDQYLAKKAKKRGVIIHLNHKFLKIKENRLIIQTAKGTKSFSSDIIIGADGPNSAIAKIINNHQQKYHIGMQVIAKLKHPKSFYEVFLGEDKGNFAWIVPETNQIARIGMLTNNNKQIKSFLKTQNIKILTYSSGPIPIYKNLKLQKKNMYIVGDAAAQLKNTTGGGIVMGLSSAKILVNAILKRKNYHKLFNKQIKTHLITHHLAYKFLKTFTDKDYDDLIGFCSRTKIKKIIEKADREKPIKPLIQLVLKEPRFLFFSKNLIKFINNKQ